MAEEPGKVYYFANTSDPKKGGGVTLGVKPEDIPVFDRKEAHLAIMTLGNINTYLPPGGRIRDPGGVLWGQLKLKNLDLPVRATDAAMDELNVPAELRFHDNEAINPKQPDGPKYNFTGFYGPMIVLKDVSAAYEAGSLLVADPEAHGAEMMDLRAKAAASDEHKASVEALKKERQTMIDENTKLRAELGMERAAKAGGKKG